jgi:chitosanase
LIRFSLALALVAGLVGGCATSVAGPVPTRHPSPATARVGAEPFSQRLASASPTPSSSSKPAARNDLADPAKKEVAMQLLSSAENSSLDWRAQYAYIQDIDDGRGYTAGIVGFCSGTGDMLHLVEQYERLAPGSRLARYLPALRAVNGGDSHDGLDPGFTGDWKAAAGDRLFQQAQDAERDSTYFNPAVSAARQDGLRPLGQFTYFDATVMHGADGLAKLRKQATAVAAPPAQGGDEVAYLSAFLDARVALMKSEPAHRNTSRVDTEQRLFLDQRNLDLALPLSWQVYGTPYSITR